MQIGQFAGPKDPNSRKQKHTSTGKTSRLGYVSLQCGMSVQPLMPLLPRSRKIRSMIPDDLKELLRAFNEHAVKYLIVGGYAFGVHAEPRATKDLDIFIRSDEENGKAVFRALTQYGAPLADLTPADFMDGTTFQIGQPPARIDILQQIDGITFDEAWANRLQGLIDGQIQAVVISRDDLIRNKLATGREQDMLDAKKLRAAAKK